MTRPLLDPCRRDHRLIPDLHLIWAAFKRDVKWWVLKRLVGRLVK